MPVYEYQAKTIEGIVLKGKMEALDETSVTSTLRQKNYYPMYIALYKETNNIKLSQFTKVTTKDIAIFCRQFSFIIVAGINILRALEILKEQTENVKLKKIITEVLEEVQKGIALSDAMKKYNEIPEMLTNMIGVGEASGNLDRIMLRMSDYYDKEYKLQQKVKGALTYPIIVCIVAICVVIFLLVKVLPIFISNIVASGGELPMPTKIVLGISDFLKTKGLLLLIALTLIVILLKIYIRDNPRAAEAIDAFKLRIPIFGRLIGKIVTARFARTFGMLMSSGVSIIPSIEICATILGNKIIRNALASTMEEIKKGNSLGEALEVRKVFPLMLTQMIKVGEESGTLDTILEKTAEFYDGEVDTATQQLTIMLEPIIIVVLSIVVGFIVIAMIMPMFAMYSALNNAN
jgi:type IV pilus assembly protein PilC